MINLELNIIRCWANSSIFLTNWDIRLPREYLIRSNSSAAPALNPESMLAGMQRSKLKIPAIATVIDVGAAEGTWYAKAVQVFPGARYVLFEPLAERAAVLNLIASANSNVSLRFSALGKKNPHYNLP